MNLQYANISRFVKSLQLAGCNHFVLNPGSRNAPIINAIAQLENKVYSQIDERCGGYIALGIGKQSDQPVGIVCTSGTAALNLTPAIAEAYYQGVCLIAITADRPENAEHSFESQTINQKGIFKNFTIAELSIDLSQALSDSEFDNILYHLVKAKHHKLPLHINLHLSEPLYELTYSKQESDNPFENHSIPPIIEESSLSSLQIDLSNYTQPLVFLGFGLHKTRLSSNVLKVPFLSDPCSPNYQDGNISTYDYYLGTLNEIDSKALQPDLLITYGSYMLSKNLRNWLKKYPPKFHLHVGNQNDFISPFTANYRVLNISLDALLPPLYASLDDTFFNEWKCVDAEHCQNLKTKTNNFNSTFFQSLFWILSKVSNTKLHCGNSMSIRYAAIFQAINNKYDTLICNRGTSGIDGCLSTFLGFAAAQSEKQWLLIGDISFFYDNNAFWLKKLPSEFEIIVINNGGGKIFDVIAGPEKMEHRKEWITTPHTQSVHKIALLHGLNYNPVHNLEEAMALSFDKNQRRIIEIFDNDPSTIEEYKTLFT